MKGWALVGAMVVAALAPAPIARAAPAERLAWLALGDSYASGEGIPGTERPALGEPECARATGHGTDATAWAIRAYRAASAREPRLATQTFVACTGAITDDVEKQIVEAESSTARRWDVVSLSFGGNNVKFADVIRGCIDLSLSWDDVLSPGCDVHLDQLKRRIDMLAGSRSVTPREFAGTLTLPHLYDKVAAEVRPGGHVMVAGYPNLIEEVSRWDFWRRNLLESCEGIGADDVAMLREASAYLNRQIAHAVANANRRHASHGVRFSFIDVANDVYETGEGGEQRHGLCSAHPWLNGQTVGVTSGDIRWQRSFHPTQNGHDAVGSFVTHWLRDAVDLAAMPAVEPLPADLRNARLPAGICRSDAPPVQLRNGSAKNTSRQVANEWGDSEFYVNVGDTVDDVRADLTGDGVEDVAFTLACEGYGGGNNWFIHVIVITSGHDGLRLLGDLEPDAHDTGVGEASVELRGGRLRTRDKSYGPDDPRCCPTVPAYTEWTWNGDRFVQSAAGLGTGH